MIKCHIVFARFIAGPTVAFIFSSQVGYQFAGGIIAFSYYILLAGRRSALVAISLAYPIHIPVFSDMHVFVWHRNFPIYPAKRRAHVFTSVYSINYYIHFTTYCL